VIEAIEVALKRGSGRLNVYRLVEEGEPELWRFSTGLHCPDSDLRYSDPIPSMPSRSTPPWARATPAGALAA
jgi:excinuclease ABC subunit A